MPTVEAVYEQLKQVYDPEIPVNIVDLGLIYEVKVDAGTVDIRMTLTSQGCPEAKVIPEVVKKRVKTIEGVQDVLVTIVWEPAWSVQRVSAEGRTLLGIEDEPAAE